jgi:hypothetical protein
VSSFFRLPLEVIIRETDPARKHLTRERILRFFQKEQNSQNLAGENNPHGDGSCDNKNNKDHLIPLSNSPFIPYVPSPSPSYSPASTPPYSFSSLSSSNIDPSSSSSSCDNYPSLSHRSISSFPDIADNKMNISKINYKNENIYNNLSEDGLTDFFYTTDDESGTSSTERKEKKKSGKRRSFFFHVNFLKLFRRKNEINYKERELKRLIVFPEGATTNGHVGLLLYNKVFFFIHWLILYF